MNPPIHPAKLQIAIDAAQLLFICGSILTRQLNSRTRVEVREDPQEPATSSHVSLTAESFAVLLSLSSLARCSAKASVARSMASPSASGTYPIRTRSPSSLAGAGGVEDTMQE